MIIACPQCRARYRINPPAGGKPVARVKCPACQHTFEVTFAGEPEGPPAGSAASAPEGQTGMPLILVVDDARFFREMICDLLAGLPIRTETAADGAEALQKVEALRPAMLLVDLNIPGLSGQELIKAIRRLPRGERIRVLAMSGVQRGEEIAREVRQLGADGFINKSFTPRDLQERVRQLLDL